MNNAAEDGTHGHYTTLIDGALSDAADAYARIRSGGERTREGGPYACLDRAMPVRTIIHHRNIHADDLKGEENIEKGKEITRTKARRTYGRRATRGRRA